MSLTVREAQDAQLVAGWVASLTSWETTGALADVEPDVADALARLADRSRFRLGAGLDRRSLAAAPALAWMTGERDALAVAAGGTVPQREQLGGAR